MERTVLLISILALIDKEKLSYLFFYNHPNQFRNAHMLKQRTGDQFEGHTSFGESPRVGWHLVCERVYNLENFIETMDQQLGLDFVLM